MRTLLFLSALVATPAFAGGGSIAEHVDKVMARLDTDHDGRISLKEAQAKPRFASHFARIDTDKDGYVTPAELTAAFERHLKR
jgi:Ca2+-binding EF-hand superfamily protein